MDKNNEKHLGFVLKYYRHGALDTREAMEKVMRRTGMKEPTRRPWRYVAVAAAVAVLIVGASVVWYNHSFATVELTAIADRQTFTLPDSTHITLRQGTTVSYKRNNPRAVTLEGTAYFQVHHDAEHPFTVSNSISTVRVLGTKFEVEAPQTASTEVYVDEGRVLFSAANQAKGIILTRGMKARIDNGDHAPRLIKSGSVNQTAWATGKFHFIGTPIQQVLSDLADCYGVRLSCAEQGKRLTGDIQADNLPDVIQLIEQTLDVRINVIKEK